MNFGTPVPLLLGIILVIGAVILFFLDRLKPGYARDYDKVYAILSLLSGLFLLGNLTMELIPAFQQIMVVGMLISLMVQNIRSRTPVADRYAPSAPPVPPSRDDYRRSRSRPSYGSDGRMNVRAELEADRYPAAPPPDRRPMLDSRRERIMPSSDYGRSDYPDDYGDGYGTGYGDGESRSEGERRPGYDSPRNDERVRRRRPPRSRREVSERYRLNPGEPPRTGY